MLLQKFIKMKLVFTLSFILIILQNCVAPPVTKNQEEKEHENEISEDDKENIFKYRRYLTEVVEMLESDPAFRENLQNAAEDDIRTGRIADKLDLVNHHVRTQLHEIKRREIERLRHLATKEYELTNNLDTNFKSEHLQHLDHSNPHTFEIDDLKKLILKASSDLAEADKRRRAEFKEYEMRKKFEEEQKLKGLTEEERKKYIQELEQMKEKHKKHEPLHHPGSKQQLEEVWEKQDHMESQEFNPKTFFSLHDVDNNGVWDPDEVKALFLKDLNKMYSPGAPEDDLHERDEEMERMREHVFKEFDLDQNGLISFHEFLTRTKDPQFTQDSGWKSIDEEQIYTQEEYEAFERQRQLELQRQMPPHPNDPSMHQQYPYQQVPYDPHQPQLHQAQPVPGQVAQQHYQQVPPQYNHPSDYNYQGQMGQSVHQGMPHPQQNFQPPQQHIPQQNSQHPQQNIPQQQNFHHPQQNLPHSQQNVQPPQHQINVQQPTANQQQNTQQINVQGAQVTNNNNNQQQQAPPVHQEDVNKIVNNQALNQQQTGNQVNQNTAPRSNQV
ncbi:nucleobindin-2 isoform X2 [Chelonus insularis]|uniref:nucleobindin-2 isoform X2 n=1 Tax=Chelonus insularis TaxID=460826 RepID=UPI00158B3726|nr:nucleobindin-2 isoform X2 [Chelonus insularis]